MNWFPGAEISNELTYPSPHGGSRRASPSPRPFQQDQLSYLEMDVDRESIQDARRASWHAPISHGLGLITPPVTTPASYVTTAPLNTFTTDHQTMSLGWPSELTSSAPATCRPEPVRKDSCSDQSCDPLSTLLPGALWDHLRPMSSTLCGYETSPGRSEYSRSSHPSAVSSPYAHSDVYIQPIDSPPIKIEHLPDQRIPEIHFVAEDDDQYRQDTSVNPEQIMKDEDTSIEERLKSFLSSSNNSDNGDNRPHNVQAIHRRAHSFTDFDTLSLAPRRKQRRIHTKPENANFRCDRCGGGFKRAFNLRSHITNVHNREKNQACHFRGCSLRFVRKTDLTRHIDSVRIFDNMQMLVLTWHRSITSYETSSAIFAAKISQEKTH